MYINLSVLLLHKNAAANHRKQLKQFVLTIASAPQTTFSYSIILCAVIFTFTKPIIPMKAYIIDSHKIYNTSNNVLNIHKQKSYVTVELICQFQALVSLLGKHKSLIYIVKQTSRVFTKGNIKHFYQICNTLILSIKQILLSWWVSW